MIKRKERRWLAWVTLAILLMAWLPYGAGWIFTPPEAHFTGLIYNPIDGHSYIAKMRQGAEGSWLFRLVYTPEPQPGAALFLFHLLLGHVARWTGLPLILVYHGARTVGGLALLWGLYRLVAHLSEEIPQRRFLFMLTALGAGLGWLAAPLGWETPDLWVYEAYPFASILVNGHFPAALALMAWAAHWGLQAETSPRAGLGLVIGAVALGPIQPFGLVPLMAGLAGAWGGHILRERRIPWRGLGWTGLATLLALPYPLYMLWVMQADPVLAAWSEQNVTPSPSLWSWLLGLGLLGPLALVGIGVAGRRRRDVDGLLLGWALTTGVGLVLPLALARRLSLGWIIPLGPLAGLGWGWIARRLRGRRRLLLTRALVGIAAMTPLFLLTLGLGATLGEHPLLYLSDGEWETLEWLEDHVPRNEVVLCAPETGIFIPAWGGQRVVYGHPFETINAEERERQVEQFWLGERSDIWLDDLGVEYLFYGPRERALGPPPAGEPLFEQRDTALYRR